MEYFDPIYKLKIKLDPLEESLIETKYFKKLRHVFHAGLQAFILPLRHTRFEHSLGLLALAKYFNLPKKIQIAALLHDIGHIAFSHSSERAFKEGLHHELTKNIILKTEIGKILKSFGFAPKDIVNSINEWPLNSKEGILNLDHFESFLRDTYYFGVQKISPVDIIKTVEIKNFGIVAKDKEIGKEIMRLCIKDNERISSNQSLVSSCLGVEAFRIAKKEGEIDLNFLKKATEYEVISRMLNSKNKKLRRLIFDILFNLEKFRAIKVEKSNFKFKLYLESIFYKRQKFEDLDLNIKAKFEKLKAKEGFYKAIKIK